MGLTTRRANLSSRESSRPPSAREDSSDEQQRDGNTSGTKKKKKKRRQSAKGAPPTFQKVGFCDVCNFDSEGYPEEEEELAFICILVPTHNRLIPHVSVDVRSLVELPTGGWDGRCHATQSREIGGCVPYSCFPLSQAKHN